MTININNEQIRIRPSAVDGFFQCAYQWGKTFLEGVTTIPNSRAAIGTAVHAGAEQMWLESQKKGDKVVNLSLMTDAAMDSWKEETQNGTDVSFDEGENNGTAAVEIVKGVEAFADDIVPYTKIPSGVEEFYKVDLDHPIVTEIGGTVDYINASSIADIKTSKRKPSMPNYSTQQSIYKFLANANGLDVKHNLIQSIVFKRNGDAEGAIYSMDEHISVEQAKKSVNTMLDVLDVVHQDIIPIETLLRGNPKYYLCSPKYCALYNDCPFVQGKDTKKVQVAL